MGEKRPELQQLLSQVDGLNFELLELVDRMNSTQLPPIPDIEEVHFAIDKCQVRTYIYLISEAPTIGSNIRYQFISAYRLKFKLSVLVII